MDHLTALNSLAELSRARGILDPDTLQLRATAILDRADLALLDPTDYLIGRGLTEYPLARLVGPFSTRLVELFTAQHGNRPLKHLKRLPVGPRPVYTYLESDRPLFDRAWYDLLNNYSDVGSRVDGIVGEHLMAEAGVNAA